jgi:hypothetical protein
VEEVVVPHLAAAPKNDKYAALGERGPRVSFFIVETLKCHPYKRHHPQHHALSFPGRGTN